MGVVVGTARAVDKGAVAVSEAVDETSSSSSLPYPLRRSMVFEER